MVIGAGLGVSLPLLLAGFLEVIADSGFSYNISGLSWGWLYLMAQMPDIDAYMV